MKLELDSLGLNHKSTVCEICDFEQIDLISLTLLTQRQYQPMEVKKKEKERKNPTLAKLSE